MTDALLREPNLLDLLERPLTLAERFEAFHAANPHVLVEFESLCEQVIATGRRKIGAKTLAEVLRWRYWLTTDDPTSHYRLNNNHTAFYARLILERHPEWDGLFELRGGEQ